MKNLFVGVIASLCVLSCGVGSDDATEAVGAVSVKQQRLSTEVPAMPATPAKPTDYQTYLRAHGGRLMPTGITSAYTVAVLDPDDTKYFLVLSYDVVKGANLFYLRGLLGDYPAMMGRVTSEVNQVPQSNPTSAIENGAQGQLKTPTPPIPPSGVPPLVWAMAYNTYLAAHQY